jgi:hypothetical protein
MGFGGILAGDRCFQIFGGFANMTAARTRNSLPTLALMT